MKLPARRKSLLRKPSSRRTRVSRIQSFIILTLAVAFIHLVVLASMQIPLLQNILGYESSITVDQVYTQINAKRVEKGQGSLNVNNQLSAAAYAKAQDMLQKGYWAHTSPEGKEPWNFITEHGYSYQVAGENLARNFDSTTPMVDAWQASPTHNANLISSAYFETGIAVLQGEMDGVPTTLVVQLFAAPQRAQRQDVIAQDPAQTETIATEVSETEPSVSVPPQTTTETSQPEETSSLAGPARVIGPEQEALLGIQALRQDPEVDRQRPVLSPLDLYRGATVTAMVIMGGLLLRDFRREKKRPGKYSGSKHLAHFILLLGIVCTLLIMKSGTLL